MPQAKPKRSTYSKWVNGYDGAITKEYKKRRKAKLKTTKKSKRKNRK